MELRRYQDILAMKSAQGAFVAFHARNLEVADISEQLWESMQSAASNDPVFQTLTEWERQNNLPMPSQPKQIERIKSITLNVTQICNLACTYCAAGGDGTFGDPIKKISVERTIPQLNFLLDKLIEGDTFTITYLGGEPLLYPDGIQILAEHLNQQAVERRIQVKHRIVTNGTLLTQKNVSMLAQLKAHVVISLDGVKDVNDQLRPMKNGKSSTEEIELGIERLQSVRDMISSLTLSAVFGRSNMNVFQTYQYFLKLNPNSIELNFDHDEQDLNLSQQFAKAYSEVLQAAWNLGGETEIRRISRMDQIFTNLDQQSRVMNYCGAGKSFVMIDAKNNIYPCVWSPNKAENAIGTGTYLPDSARTQFQNPLVEKQGCNTCWARYLCGGGCEYVHEKASRTAGMPAEVFCFQSRSLISLAISYYQQCRKAS